MYSSVCQCHHRLVEWKNFEYLCFFLFLMLYILNSLNINSTSFIFCITFSVGLFRKLEWWHHWLRNDCYLIKQCQNSSVIIYLCKHLNCLSFFFFIWFDFFFQLLVTGTVFSLSSSVEASSKQELITVEVSDLKKSNWEKCKQSFRLSFCQEQRKTTSILHLFACARIFIWPLK